MYAISDPVTAQDQTYQLMIQKNDHAHKRDRQYHLPAEDAVDSKKSREQQHTHRKNCDHADTENASQPVQRPAHTKYDHDPDCSSDQEIKGIGKHFCFFPER